MHALVDFISAASLSMVTSYEWMSHVGFGCLLTGPGRSCIVGTSAVVFAGWIISGIYMNRA